MSPILNLKIKRLEDLAERLYDIPRSVTGEGQLKTLKELQTSLSNLTIKKIETGQEVHGWTIPDEWTFNSLQILDDKMELILSDSVNPLRVINHSQPIDKKLKFKDLRENLHTSTENKHGLPYLTSYYQKNWGICVSSDEYAKLKEAEDPLTIKLNTSFKSGHLYIGELFIKGKSDAEILISTYICHPNLANDNLSGILCAADLAEILNSRQNYFSIRILFLPETIGPIAYAAKNPGKLEKSIFGFVLTTCGGTNELSLKHSFDKSNVINKVALQTLEESGLNYQCYDFDYHGSDERQYSSPGLRLNCVSLCYDKYYTYPEYHSSADNFDILSFENILLISSLYSKIIEKFTEYPIFISSQKFGEPFLSKYNLYNKLGGSYRAKTPSADLDILLGVIFWSDGKKSVYEISKLMKLPIAKIKKVSTFLCEQGLLKRI